MIKYLKDIRKIEIILIKTSKITFKNMNKIKLFNNYYDKTYKKKIKKCMKGDKYQLTPPILNDNSFLVVSIGPDNKWQSFLHCFVKDKILTFSSGFTNKMFRRKGLSTELRIWVINNIKNINKIDIALRKLLGFVKPVTSTKMALFKFDLNIA